MADEYWILARLSSVSHVLAHRRAEPAEGRPTSHPLLARLLLLPTAAHPSHSPHVCLYVCCAWYTCCCVWCGSSKLTSQKPLVALCVVLADLDKTLRERELRGEPVGIHITTERNNPPSLSTSEHREQIPHL